MGTKDSDVQVRYQLLLNRYHYGFNFSSAHVMADSEVVK